ncbi:hypothetical protein ACFX1Z_024731 [Malus domestica]
MCQILSTKHAHPTTTKEEQIIHIDEGQTMAPSNEKSMKMDMVVRDQAKMEMMASIGQTPTLGGGTSPHLMWSPKKKKIAPTLFPANTSMLSASRSQGGQSLGSNMNGHLLWFPSYIAWPI